MIKILLIMLEVLYCAKYGGYGLSNLVIYELYKSYPDMFPITNKDEYEENNVIDEKDLTSDNIDSYVRDEQGIIRGVYGCAIDYNRTDKNIINIVKSCGIIESSGKFCKLKIKQIPDGYTFKINEYDGKETVAISPDYKSIIRDLVEFYKTGSKDFKSSATEKVINGEIII